MNNTLLEMLLKRFCSLRKQKFLKVLSSLSQLVHGPRTNSLIYLILHLDHRKILSLTEGYYFTSRDALAAQNLE